MLDFADKQLLFLDYETFYDRKNHFDLKSVSLTEFVRDARFAEHGFAYAWGTDAAPTWTTSSADAVFADVDWSQTVVVAHNVKFDGSILSWRYGASPYAWFDTWALARAILGERVPSHSLKGCAEYLGLTPKGELKVDGKRTLTTAETVALGEYCVTDVQICQGIFKALFPQFPQSQLWHVDWTIRAFIDARLTLNTALLEEGVSNEKKRREAAIQRSGVDRATLSSNQKFAAHLVSAGHDVVTKRSLRTGKQIPAFGKSDEGLAALPETLRDARLAAKSSLLETRGVSLLRVARSSDRRLFPFDVNFSGAVQTHRYSGGGGAGGNPQNFTRGSFLRAAVESSAGSALVVGDFAAIELRILSWLAREPKLINAIVNELDVYSDFAGRFYGRSISRNDKSERQFGKCAILGLGYGMGAKKFAATVKAQLKIDLTEAQARQTIDLYRNTYFNVPRLWELAQQAIPLIADGRVSCLHFAPFVKVRKNVLVLPSGLTIQYPNLRAVPGKHGHADWVYDTYRKRAAAEEQRLYGGKLVENLCQALAGDICKEAIYRTERAGLRCVGAVHDEIIAVTEWPGSKAAAVLVDQMSKSPTWWPEIRLGVEAGSGSTWAGAK